MNKRTVDTKLYLRLTRLLMSVDDEIATDCISIVLCAPHTIATVDHARYFDDGYFAKHTLMHNNFTVGVCNKVALRHIHTNSQLISHLAHPRLNRCQRSGFAVWFSRARWENRDTPKFDLDGPFCSVLFFSFQANELFLVHNALYPNADEFIIRVNLMVEQRAIGMQEVCGNQPIGKFLSQHFVIKI